MLPASAPPAAAAARGAASSHRLPASAGALVPALVGLAVLLVVGLVAWAALAGGGDDPSGTANRGGGPSAPTSSASAPSPSPSPLVLVAALADRRDRRRHGELHQRLPRHRHDRSEDGVGDAHPVVPGGQRWLRALPGVLEDHRQRAADLDRADPQTLQVHYSVDYVEKKHQRATSDDVTLQLVYQDGNYLIDGES